jgi:hypothetical protein
LVLSLDSAPPFLPHPTLRKMATALANNNVFFHMLNFELSQVKQNLLL